MTDNNKTTDPDKINHLTNRDGKTYSKQDIVNRVLKTFTFSELPAKLQSARFNSLDERFSDVKTTLLQWDYLTPNIVSFLSNKNGVGKSYLSVCLYKQFIKTFVEKAIDNIFPKLQQEIENSDADLNALLEHLLKPAYPNVLYTAERSILLRIRDSYDTKKETELSILSDYASYDMLVIDDMFATKHNDFASGLMYSIIDERSEWRNKPTVITSNFNAEEIRAINSRIESRINNSLMFEFSSDKFTDFRKQ